MLVYRYLCDIRKLVSDVSANLISQTNVSQKFMTTNKSSKQVVSVFLALLLSISSLVAVPFYASAAPTFVQVEAGTSTHGSFGSWISTFMSRPTIKGIDPESGPTGTTVTLTGKKFNDDSVVRLGRGVVSDPVVSDDGTTLTFVIPEEIGRYCPPYRSCTQIAYEVEPGDYDIRVQNNFRSSNAVPFEVTDDTTEPPSDDPVVIDSVTGPLALESGTEGTWTVAVRSESEGSLRYSVKWGDEPAVARLFGLTENVETQSSATFAHTYTEPGTYRPEFTVTDEEGNSVTKISDAVVVSDSSAIPQITSITPTSALVDGSVTITGTGFDSDSTVSVGGLAGLAVDVKSDTTIVFTVPALPAGTHALTVTDNDGTSNALDLEVLAKKGKVSISGIEAPTRLDAGETGTWTVAVNSNLSGNLRYSVDWGETTSTFARQGANVETQSSATFEHAYENPGTYHPKFTVTDEQGNTTSVKTSVFVMATE